MSDKSDMVSHGYVIAGLLFNFVKFIEKNAKYPIKFLMRDAEPMLFTTNKLAENGLVGLKDYEAVYLTRDIAKFYTKDLLDDEDFFEKFGMKSTDLHETQQLIHEYMKQHGIDKDHTEIDSGVVGTIPKALYSQDKKCKVQSLYFSGSTAIKYSEDKPWFHGISDSFFSYPSGGASRYDIHTSAAPILEASPKSHKVSVLDFEKDETGNVVVKPKFFNGENRDNYDDYYKGIDIGLNDIIKHGTEIDKEKLFEILNWTYDEIKFKDYGKQEDEISILCDISHYDISRTRDEVEQMYCGR